MATNARNGRSKRQLSNTDSGADKKANLKLSFEDYYHWQWLLGKKELKEKDNRHNDLKIQNLDLQIKVLNLQKSLMQVKGSDIQQQIKDCGQEVNKLRDQIAEKLNIDSLDPYVLDDVSLELIHEEKLEGRA